MHACDAIVFDLGNTLLPWGEEQERVTFDAIQATFVAACGPMPDFVPRALALRSTLLHERSRTTMRELTVEELVGSLYDAPPPAGLVDAVAATVHETFVEVARFPDGLKELLLRLGRSRPLAVLSNFFMTSPIEAALDRAGLTDCFKHIEVSATRGLMKPHPEPFEIVREKLGTPMERTLMVGDDVWADIVGGHRAGFRTALSHEHRQGPTSDPRAPEIRPDKILQRLDELDDQS